MTTNERKVRKVSCNHPTDTMRNARHPDIRVFPIFVLKLGEFI